MNKPFKPNLPHLEKAYTEMSSNLSIDLLKYIAIGFSMNVLNELVLAIIRRRVLPILFLTSVCILVFFTLKTIWHKRKTYNIGITIFCIIFYFCGLFFEYMDGKYFIDPIVCFYFSCSYAVFERVLIEGISNIRHRTAFTIISLLIRFIVIPRTEFLLHVIQVFVVSLAIVLDIYRDKRNKYYFCSYYSSNEQLSKFKDLVVQHIPEAIAIVSQDLNKGLFVNNSFTSLVSQKKTIHRQLEHFLVMEEMENTKIGENGSPTSPCKRTMLDVLRAAITNEAKSFESQTLMVRSIKKKKQEIGMEEKEESTLFQARIIPLIWEDEACIAIIMHDITQHHTILSLKIADKQKDKVLATVSHELKTPLNGMLGMIQIMEKKIKDTELLSFLSICKTSTNLLVSLVSSILDLNQIKANKIKLNIESIDVHELLRNIANLFDYQCRHKGLYLKTLVKPGTPRFLNTDRDRLSQVLINLVGNAHKFTSRGGIIIKADLEGVDSVRFSIKDTGIGIANEDRGKLFQVFGRLDPNNKKINRQGVGLGLTIAESLVQVLNGNTRREPREITVESEQGIGSTFSFMIRNRIPVKPVSPDRKWFTIEQESEMLLTVPSEEIHVFDQLEFYTSNAIGALKPSPKGTTQQLVLHKSPIKEPRLKNTGSPYQRRKEVNIKPCVLIVDDNLFNIAVAEHLVASHGYQVKTSLSGQDAIDIVAHNNQMINPIILILMDCQMPIMDGYETTRVLKKMMKLKTIPEIPIVALTANDSETDKEACRKSGMCDHLSKPLKDMELVKMFKKYC